MAMRAFRLPAVRYLASMVLGPERDFRSPANCVDLARLRVLVAHPSVRRLPREELRAFLEKEVKGLTFAEALEDVLTIGTRDETSTYCYQVSLPP